MDHSVIRKTPEISRLLRVTPGTHPRNVKGFGMYQPIDLFEGWQVLRPALAHGGWKNKQGDLILYYQPSGDRFHINVNP